MHFKARRLVLAVATAGGLLAATAGPAVAELNLQNHSRPRVAATPRLARTQIGSTAMRSKIRRALTAAAAAVGLLAVTAGPAAAGVVLSNHTHP